MDLPIRPRLGLCIAVLCGAAVCCSPTYAQIAGTNVNMVSGTQWPGGDPFLQRQNEPSIAVSSRNPFHLLAGSNDYRSVDLAFTTNGETGDAWLGLFKSLDGGATWRSILLPGCPYNTPVCAGAPAVKNAGYQAAADPTVRAGTNGMFYYAGLVFNRGFNPHSAIIVSRLIDLNNKENADPNDILNGDAIQYIGTSIVATGTSSLFLDKPSMAVDIPRPGASTCNLSVNQPGNGEVNQSFPAGNVYVAYTAFNEPPNTDPATVTTPQESTIYFVRSTNCGATWSHPIALNIGGTVNQSVVLAINPNNGVIYAAWRQFHHVSPTMNQPDAIFVTYSTNGGLSFATPVRVSTFMPFDQGTTGTSFRTNAYPTIAVDASGRIYIAYSARNTVPSGDARIVLTTSPNGSNWTTSAPIDNPPINPLSNPAGRGHQIMPTLSFAAGTLSVLYYDLRLDHYLGLFTPLPAGLYGEIPTPAGELFNPLLPEAVFNPVIDDLGDSTVNPPVRLTVRRHTFDLRVAQALPAEVPVFAPSILVSQYAYGCCASSQADIEQLEFNAPNLPLFRSGTAPFMGDYVDLAAGPSFLPPTSRSAGDGVDSDSDDWHYNLKSSTPTTLHAAWTDNRDVQAPVNGDWTRYTPPNSPSLGSTSIFQPGTSPPACQVGFTGSRNQNIYTAPISNGLVFGAPTNTKQLGTTVFNGNTVLFQRAFAVVAQNTTNLVKSFRLTIANQPVGGSASFLQFAQLTTLDLSMPALSSATRPVFVTSTNPTASVTVNIAEITAPLGTLVPGGLTSFTTLNPDITNPAITNPAITNPAITNPAITNFEVYNPAITNPAITNPAITNPAITNPAITNPAITNSSFQSTSVVNPAITNLAPNPAITNPAITNASVANPAITNPAITNVTPNESITDTQWTLSNTGNTEGSFTLNLASSSPVPLNNVLQLIISKLYQTPAAPSGQSCNLEVETHNVVVTNIANPVLLSPTNPAITNPAITNPAITNPTVALAPGETANIIIRVVNPDTTANPTFNAAASVAPVAVAQAINTQTALGVPPGGTPPPPPVTAPPLQITTTSLPNTVIGSLYAAAIQTAGGNLTSHTFSIISGALPAGLTLGQTAGTISGKIAASSGTFSFVVQAQDVASGAFPQHTATQNLSITVTASGPVITSVSPTPLLAPATPHVSFAGNFVITGQNLQGATVTTDGPLLLTGAAVVNAAGTSISQGYSIGCCAPQQGQVFHLFVNTAAGTATLADTIALTSQVPASVTFVSEPSNSIGGQILGGSPVVVQVTDQSGAAIAGIDVTMSFNGTPPCSAAVLSGTLTQVTTATGQAMFPDLSIDRGQLGYTLRAVVGNASAASNPFPVEGFCGTASLSTPRELQTDVLLGTGQVLIAGGFDNATGVLSTAEIYDPVAGTVAPTGNLAAPNGRAQHASVVLPNGKVLLAGGADKAVNPLATAELYDPANGTFSATGSMAVARNRPTAVLLADGRVLVAGGSNSSGALASAEIYDPATGAFTSTGNMNQARARQTMTLLPNGTVLVAGGRSFGGASVTVFASAEIFDPTANGGAGAFTSIGNMNSPRDDARATLLANGKVLIVGGFVSYQTGLSASSAEIFDPATNTFTLTGSMSIARAQPTASILPDGRVMVAGGVPDTGSTTPATTTAEVFDPATGTFVSTGPMITGREFAGAVVAAGKPIISGGDDGINTTATQEIFYSVAPSAPIAITTASLANAATGAPYTQILLEQGGVGNLTWTEAGTLPTGITFSNQGVLSGTPTVGGSFPLIITVTDSSTPAKTVSANFTLTVTNSNSALVFTSSTVPTAVAGRPYSQPIPVAGGTQPYNATVTSGTLPPGLLLTTNGVLNGTPSGTGNFSFTVTVTDSSSPTKTATQTLTMSVNTLVITTTVLPNGIVGVPYSAAINTVGGTLPLSFSLTNASFPPGLAIQQPAATSSSGALAGTPTLAGKYSFSESVVDTSSPAQTATQNYVVTIAPVGTPAPANVTFVSQPQNSVGGQTLASSPIVVRVADSTNTAITGATVAMSFNGAPPCAAATLNGTLTAVTDGSGNATFSNLSIDRGQFGYTLLASAGSASAVSSPFNVQGFCNSANLSTQREFHTQVLLGTGKVLIAGGIDNLGNAVNTAELYDPATGTTSPTGNLSDPNGRLAHITVLLPNGKVLLAGGTDNVTAFALSTAELYDPAAGTFSPTGSMAHPRYLAEAVLLADGRVLVAGGINTNTGLNTAEIYDPATGLWTPTGNMTQGRIRHRMTLLPNGKVLVTGGRDAAVNFFGLSSAELFDPFANQGVGAFTAIGNMNSVRFVHGQSLLSNGTVLVAGGFDNTFASLTSAEIFDPATNLFTLTGNMSIGRSRHSSTLLPDGSVLETGGINTINGFTPPAPAELYLPAGGSFARTGSMTTGRELAGATLLPNGDVLVSGGDDAVNELNSTEVYYNTAPIAPIQITATTVPNAFVGQPYVATALEQNGTGPITWSTVSGSLPPGLKGNTIGTYGVVYGTPTTAGSFTFTAQVTDGHSVATRSFTINVSVATLAFTSNTMPTGGVGRAYSQPLPVTGGTQPYAATVTSGTLPPGLALSSNGVLSGTPSSAGSFTFTASVSDSSTPMQTATQTLAIGVNTLFITTTALPGGMVGVPYNAVISTTGGTLPLTFSAATAAFPPGLAIQQPAANSPNGALAGTPTQAGHFTFTESVVDSSTPAQTATQYYIMDIFPAGTTAVPASAVFLSQPQNSVGGQILTGSPIRVRVFDASNTPIVGASVAMSFNGAPPCSSAVLSGTLTAITNGNGVAVFRDLSIDRGQLGYTLLANAGSASVVSQPFTVNGFCATGNLNVARRIGTATLLPSGKVLITGGFTPVGVSSSVLSSAELYDPTSGLFTLTGSMSVAREFHTATPLPNGKVLIAGGQNSSMTFNSAELYDPATGVFALTGAMNVTRAGHTATLLANGKVLIAGGGDNLGNTLNSAELYDPATGVFTSTGSMVSTREQHTATLLSNGTVLLNGGTDNNSNILATAEIYSPSQGTFAATGSMNNPRIFQAATLLPSGKVLVAGGAVAFVPNITLTATAELYDPAVGTFSVTASLSFPDGAPAAAVLTDGNVLVTNGSVRSNVPGNSAEIFNTAINTFSATGNMPTNEIENAIVPLNDGTVLDTGGNNSSPAAFLYYSTAPLAPLQVTTPTTAPAGTTVFTTPASFAAASFGATTTGFNGIIPAGATFAGFNPLVVNGITFSTPLSTSGVNVNVTKASFYTPNVYPADFITNSVIPATGQPSANNTLTITLPAPTTAFAMDFGGLGFRGASSATITLSNGFVLPLASLPTVGHTQFAGFVSTTPFNTITFSTVNDDFVVQDVLVANADITLPGAVVGVPYTQMLLEQGGVGTLTWTLASGTLPPGITLRADGFLIGTPTSGGTFTFTVNVVDSSTPQKNTSGTFTLVVNSNFQMAVTPDGPLLAINRSFNATVTLSTPVPTGSSVTVTLTANPTGVVTISPATQTISAGQTTAVFVLTAGSTGGSVVLTASASGYPNATASLTVTANLISFGTVPVLAPGQSGSLPVSLSFAAPPGGLTINFASANTSVATITPSVFVPAGLLIPAANPQVTGMTIGSTQVNATAVGFAPDTANVTVTVTPSVSPNPIGVNATRTVNVTLTISAAAPAGGITFNLSSDNTAVATVPATVTVLQGQLSVTFGVTGVTQGTANLSVSSPGVTTVTAPITVGPAPAINLSPTIVGNNTIISVGASLTVAPIAAQNLTLTSSDPAHFLLTTDPTKVGTASITVPLSPASTAIPTFYVEGQSFPATSTTAITATITASSAGYTNGTATLTLYPTGLSYYPFCCSTFSTTTFSSPTPLGVYLVLLNPGTLSFYPSGLGAWVLGPQAPGAVPVSITSSNTSVGTINGTASITVGNYFTQALTFVPSTAGTTNLNLATPANYFTPANAPVQLVATVTPPPINVSSPVVGNNTIIPASIGLGAAPPSNAVNPTLTLTSSDPTHFLLTTDPTKVGTTSVTVNLTPGSFAVPTVYVEGQNFPATGTTAITATLTATSSGYASGTGPLTLYPTGLSYYPFCCSTFSTTTFSSPTPLGVYLVLLNPGTLSFYTLGFGAYVLGPQAPGAVPVSITSSNTSVGTINGTASITVGNNFTQALTFVPSTAGTTNLNLATPANYFTPANAVQLVATVTAPVITLGNVLVGNNMIALGSVSLGAAPSSTSTNPTLTLTSSDPTHFLLTANPTQVGTASITLNLTPGSFGVPPFYIEGQNFPAAGTTAISATLTATSSGYTNGSATLTLYPSGLAFLNNPGVFNTTTFSSPTPLSVWFVVLTPGSLTFYTYCGYTGYNYLGPQAPGAVPVSVASTNTSVGSVSGTASISVGNCYTQGLSFVPSTAGTTNLNLATPTGYFTPANQPVQIVATVTAPSINVNSTIVGNNTIIQGPIALAAAPPSNETLTLTSSDPTHFLLTADPTKVGTGSITLQLTAGSFAVPAFYIEGQNFSGVGAITATLTAKAAGYSDGIATLSLYPTGIGFLFSSGTLNTTTTSGPTILTTYLMVLNPNNLAFYTYAGFTGGDTLGPQAPGPIPVSVTSTNTSVGTVAGSPASIGVGAYFTQAISFVPAATGTTNLNLATPAGYFTPSDQPVQIVVTVQ